MLDSISFYWDPIANEWENKFELLRQYKSINCNTNVPDSYVTKEGVKLGEWVSYQRTRQDRMPTYQTSMLDYILFDWDPIANEWENRCELLRLYKSIYGNTNVPTSYVTKDGVKLGAWVSSQRTLKNRMSAYRINTLDYISFDWDPDVNEWENTFELLRLYKLINGDTNVPRRYVTKEGVKLGEWVYYQRLNKNKNSTTRISILDSISFVWDPIVNEWENNYELLCQYKAFNGNTNVPHWYSTKEGVKLGLWAKRERSNKSQMSTNRINILDSISFEWDQTVGDWESTFELLRQYKSTNGNDYVPRGYVTKEGVKLSEWINRQRSNKYQLSTNQISMLDSISFDWGPVEIEWKNNFELLRLYKSINGKTNVPQRYVTKEGVKLGQWIHTQRSNKNQMSTNRISMLDSVSFEWDPAVNEWENKFELLRQYNSINDNTYVPRR